MATRSNGAGTAVAPPVAIAFCLTLVLLLFAPPILNDGDTLWQIRTGAWILDHHAIPETDPFSFTAGNRRWFAHEWLAETLMALAFRVGGLPGVMALAAAAAAATAAMLLHHLRRFLPGIYALLALVVALSNAAPSMLARPHLLAWPCLALWCGGLVAARAARAAPRFALLAVMLVWVNLHGSFMLGLLLPGGFMIEALCDPGADRRGVTAGWGGFILSAWAVALLNPDGIGGVLFPFHLLGMASLRSIGEWMPPDFSRGLSRMQPVEITIIGLLALGFAAPVRLPPIRLLMLLGLVHGALAHGRDGQILGIVGVLIVAEPFGRCLASRAAAAASGAARHKPACNGMAVVAAAFVGLALIARLALPLGPERTGTRFADTLDRVPPALRVRPVLNDYVYGGLLIFNGVRPFIDSRADLYGDGFIRRYQRIVRPDRTALGQALADYRIAWTIFPATSPIVQMLDQQPGWRRSVEANGIVIHAREHAHKDAPAR